MSNFETHNNKDGLEDFFHKNLSDASMQPRKQSWENIEVALDEEKKKKKRFFWFFFSGFVLLIGAGCSWFLLFNTRPSSSNTSSSVKDTFSSASTSTPKPFNTISKPSTNQTIDTSPPTGSASVTSKKAFIPEHKDEAVKIQLGAFSKQVSKSKFKAVPFPVQNETGEDGITRYFITTTNVARDLETIKQAGFKDAFVKHEQPIESSVTTNHTPSKNEIVIQPDVVYSKTNARLTSSNQNNSLGNAGKSSSAVVPAIAKETIAANNHSIASTAKTTEISQNNPTTPVSGTHENAFTDPLTQQNSSPGTTQNESPTNSVNKASTDSLPQQAPPVVVKTDSVMPIAKTDSVMKPVIKKDSLKSPPDYRWAFSLMGGPNIYLNQAKTTLFNSKSETQAVTYGGDIKVEYAFIKNLSASIGVGYQSHSIEKSETRFTFSKFMTNDYIITSSFGNMVIDNSTLFQGFYMIAPVDSFFASYKYKSTIQSVNVPLQANWYFFNTSRIRLYSSIGMNVSYIVSQQSHLTLIKEHHEDDLYYKNIQAHKLNAILLLSLGCDIRLTKRFYFSVAPGYRYALTNYSPVSGITFKPSYLSATGGFKLRF
ncbi:MAG: outer membrane beta-barrel protein [Bacteroidetes bacterium]|nr:outer membrane beta-barrel protein [Bacteroidota bacterium]